MKEKDPAFLFYSKDFYEGTRTMFPEERACYIDLIIYQHQHEFIPNDIKKMTLYCNGINEATLEAVLNAKFILTESGWVNKKLQDVINKRSCYIDEQSMKGCNGQFFKTAKRLLSEKELELLKELFKGQTTKQIFEQIKDKQFNKDTLINMLKLSLSNKENEIEIEIEDINKEENNNNAETFLKFPPEYLVSPEIVPLEFDLLFEVCFKDEMWLDSICMIISREGNTVYTHENVISYKTKFKEQQISSGLTTETIREFKQHYSNYVKKQIKQMPKKLVLDLDSKKR